MTNETTQYRGFHFKDGTPAKVRDIIADYKSTGRRLRLWQGCGVTGTPWLEEYDVIGYIGRSRGNGTPQARHVPLLIANARAHGGPAISTHCVIAIQDVKTKEFLYKCEGFKVPDFTLELGGHLDLSFEVHHRGEVHARFKTRQKADKYIAFMRGERMAKG